MPKHSMGLWATPDAGSFNTPSSGKAEDTPSAREPRAYAGAEAGTVQRTKEEAIDHTWEVQQAAKEARVQDFRRTSEARYESLGADSFIRTVETFLKEVKTAAEDRDDKEAAEDKFRKKILALGEKRLGKKLKPQYQAWIEGSLANRNSRLRNIYDTWMEEVAAAKSAKAARGQTERIKLQDSLFKVFPYLSVIKRVKSVEQKLAEMAVEPPFPGEDAFKSFLIDQAWLDWDQEQGRKPSFFERLTGKPVRPPEFFLDRLLGEMSPEYALATDQYGHARKDKIKGTISLKELEPTGKGKRPKPTKVEASGSSFAISLRSMREILDGSLKPEEKVKEPNIQGLEEYKKRLKLTPEFDRCLDAVRPVLGRRSLIREVNFNEDFVRDHRDGQFDFEELRIDIFPEKMDQSRVVNVLMHETGHAISPDRTLPLKDAIAFSVDMFEAVKRTGFISNYSLASMSMVGEEMDKVITFLSKEDMDFMTERPMDEEWAEMMANALTAPVTEHVYPEKYDMVRRWLDRFGVDFQKAQEDAMAAVMGQASEKLKQKVLDESAPPEASTEDIGRAMKAAGLD